MHVTHPSKDVKQAVKNTRAKFGREIRDENINFRVVNTEVDRTQPSREQADQDEAGQSQSMLGTKGNKCGGTQKRNTELRFAFQ